MERIERCELLMKALIEEMGGCIDLKKLESLIDNMHSKYQLIANVADKERVKWKLLEKPEAVQHLNDFLNRFEDSHYVTFKFYASCPGCNYTSLEKNMSESDNSTFTMKCSNRECGYVSRYKVIHENEEDSMIVDKG